MNNRIIVCSIKPFDRLQFVYIYNNNEVESTTKIDTITLDSELVDFANTNEISTINLFGPVQYLRGFVKKMKKYELSKYSAETLTINIMENK